ncbi:MAG: PQQ-binding-like beta-propeller repeat protein [Melioribacteraceae bacterium]|nr:PQQ-binding-like beta-propeller repeat protein [Melioribacteraceae bacterium]
MKKLKYIILLLVITGTVYSQPYRYAWITDMHVGFPGAEKELDSVVSSVNKMKNIKFLIATGDISEKGKSSELETAKSILDKLKIPYFIIPGNHDTKWSESGSFTFKKLWDDDKFYFVANGDIYIGLNSGIPWQGGGGHIKPEDLRWLEEQLLQVDDSSGVYIITHHPLNEQIDNWFMVMNLLKEKNVKMSLNGHGHANKITEYNGLPAVMSRSTLSKNQDSWGYTIVESDDSLLKFYEVDRSHKPVEWGQINKTEETKIKQIDSVQFISYKADIKLHLDLESTMISLPLYDKGKIYSCTENGIATCFDSTGSILWQYDTFGNVYSQPVIIDGYLIISTIQGDLITLNAFTGEQIQSIGFDESITSQLLAFDYTGNKTLLFPKATESKACVVLGTSSGKLYCYDVETLQEYWVFDRPGGMIQMKPLHIGNKIVFGCWDSKIYCIDDRTGLLIWEWDKIKNFYYSPAVCQPVTDGKKIYITSPNKYLYAIDLQLGITEWQKDSYNAWESVGISNDKRLLYVKDINDKLHLVSAITSNWVKIVKINFGLDTMPGTIINYKDKILFNSKNGSIYSVDSKYNYETVLFMGTSRVQSLQVKEDDLLLASNMDGKIILFSIK